MQDRWIAIPQAAVAYNRPAQTLYSARRRHRIRSKVAGGEVLLLVEDVERYCGSTPAPTAAAVAALDLLFGLEPPRRRRVERRVARVQQELAGLR